MSGRAVWVFRIPLSALSVPSDAVHYIPEGAEFLHAHEQHGMIALWFEIPRPEARLIERRFFVFGTGTGPIDDGLDYVATTIHAGGALVLHVYEATS